MPRVELDAQLAACARKLLADAQSLLLIGARSEGLAPVVSEFARPEDVEAVTRAHEGALWCAPSDALRVRQGIAMLRGKLARSAPILLAVRRRPPVFEQVRGMLGGSAPAPVRVEALCGALLISGLIHPRVHDAPRAWLLLSASLPAQPCSLDAFFAQPPSS